MVNVLPLHSHGAAFTQSGLAARRDGRAASPTPAPRSAPRTETTTAAPASAPSSPQEVPPLSPFLPPPPLLLLTPYRLNLSLLITDLFKHHPPAPFPSAVNVPRSDSCSPCANIKLLLTYYSCAFGCCISWAQIQLIPTSFFSLPPCLLYLELSDLGLPLCRLVVWGVRPLQPERHLLPQLVQHGTLQQHQVVLLEGAQPGGLQNDHDGATGQLLTARCQTVTWDRRWRDRIPWKTFTELQKNAARETSEHGRFNVWACADSQKLKEGWGEFTMWPDLLIKASRLFLWPGIFELGWNKGTISFQLVKGTYQIKFSMLLNM